MKYLASFCTLFLLFIWCAEAQSIEEARELYSAERYGEARPVFEAIAKSSAKKMEAWKPEAYRSLGHIYYIGYEFALSAAAYRQAGEGALAERSERAGRMLAHCEDVQVIDSVVVDKELLLDAYLLGPESGRLAWSEEGTVMYENTLGDKRFFSEGKKGYGRRLYSEIRMQGEWTDRREMDVPADSLDNNVYPFALTDGLTVYYASDSKSSIGGYDLFVTRYNLNNDTWLAPSQMGMPFNSIGNDYLLAIDEENGVGYFATDRFQEAGKVTVYTFVPNESFVPLEAASAGRAKLSSIRSTWKAGVDYGARLEAIRRLARREPTRPAYDFTFVIDDGTVYHAIGDFRADAAKQAFLKWRETLALTALEEGSLDALRMEYAGADAATRQRLRGDIMLREDGLEALLAQSKMLEKSVRNLELRSRGINEINH
jgi:hypothetical protein